MFASRTIFTQEEALNEEITNEIVDESTLILNTTANDPANVAETVDFQAITFSDLLRIILVLLMVIAAIYAVLYLLKRFSTSSIDGSSLIKIVGSKGLMKDSALHLVEVGNQVFLIGSGSSAVNLISEITDSETIDNIRLNQSKENLQKKGSFASIISSQLGINRRKKVEEQIGRTESFLKNQRAKLKDL